MAPTGLVEALREATRALHVEAEKTGIINDLLRGRADRNAYALLLRNIVPAYRAMEAGLRTAPASSPVRSILRPELDRAGAIETDLVAINGADWETTLPLLPEGERYAARVAAAARGDATRLAAHAYARYLGDLSGGQILARLLGKSLGLGPDALNFYAFPGIADVAAFKADYRAALDRAGAATGNIAALAEEGAMAFRLNIDVSVAVAQAVER